MTLLYTLYVITVYICIFVYMRISGGIITCDKKNFENQHSVAEKIKMALHGHYTI